MANIVSSKSFSITNVIKDFASSIMQAMRTLGENSEENDEKDLELQVKEIEKQESDYIKKLEEQINPDENKKGKARKKEKRVIPAKTTVTTKHNEVNRKEREEEKEKRF